MLPVRTFRSLKYPLFRLYFVAIQSHRVSTNMQMLVRSLLIYRLTGSATILGMMALASTIPMMAMSLYGGAMADRVQKKHVIMAGELVAAAVSLGVGISLTVGYLTAENSNSWWILAASSIIQGAINGLTLPAQQSIIPELVSEKHILNALSLNSMSANVIKTFAPAAGGFLVHYFGFASVYYIMTGMYLITFAVFTFMPPTSSTEAHQDSALVEMKAGLKFARNDPTVFPILALTLLAFIFSLPYLHLIPIFADDILKVGSTGLGFLISASGIGAIISALVLASIPMKKRGFMLMLSILLVGLALASFSFSSTWYLSLVMMGLVGLSRTAQNTLSKTLLYHYTPMEFRGRVISIFTMEKGFLSAGVFLAGILSDVIGVQWALGSFAIILVFISLGALAFLPRIRNLK